MMVSGKNKSVPPCLMLFVGVSSTKNSIKIHSG
jgi:hypothetical protein